MFDCLVGDLVYSKRFGYLAVSRSNVFSHSYVFGDARLFTQCSFRLSSFYLRKILFIIAASVLTKFHPLSSFNALFIDAAGCD